MAERQCGDVRILLVEDEPAAADGFREDVGGLPFEIDLEVSPSRNASIALLDTEDFDLIVCDLVIPAASGSLDQSVQHGLAVYEHAKAAMPGTPAIFLTGHADYRDVRQHLPSRGPEDIFGDGHPIQMVDLFYKEERDKYLAYIRLLAEGYQNTEAAVDVEAEFEENPLSSNELRLLKIYARGMGAYGVVARQLGGLSDMRALHLEFRDKSNAHVAWAFGKLGVSRRIEDERQRFLTVSPRLRVGAYAPLVGTVQAGAGRLSALFYNLADDYPHSAFEWLHDDPNRADDFVQRLRSIVDDWQQSKSESERSIGDLRRAQISDSQLEPYLPKLDRNLLERIEGRTLTVVESLQHGDLHGFNVLVRDDGQPILIDFGRTELASCCLDPIVLELSVLFHEQSPFREGSWPSVEQCDAWVDLETYISESPVGQLIRVLRAWASGVASDEALCATALCHALRQLKYADTNKDRAVAIARSCLRRLSEVG